MSIGRAEIATWWQAADRIRPDLRIFAALAAAYALWAATSYLDPGLSASGLFVFVGLVALLAPIYGIALLILLVPFRNLFAVDPTSLDWTLGLLMAALAVRLCHHVVTLRQWPRSLLWALAGFLILVALRTDLGGQPVLYVQSAGFVLALLVIAIAVRDLMCQERFPRLMGTAFAAGLTLALAFSLTAITFPEMRLVHGLSPDVGYRLIGAHDNPNALAKFLLLYVAFALAILPGLSESRLQRRLWLGLGFIVVVLALCATGSRSSILAVFGSLSALAAWSALRRRAEFTRPALVALALSAAVFAAWLQWLGPSYVAWAKHRWGAAAGGSTDVWQQTPLSATGEPSSTFLAKVRSGLRLDETIVLAKPDGAPPTSAEEVYTGDVTYTPVRCDSVVCLGARGDLWRGGWQAIASSWVFGIGFRQWSAYFQRHLGFPFDSPHNAVLELWGSLGLPGLLLYVGFVAVLLKRLDRFLASSERVTARPLVTVGIAFAAVMVLNEIPEPAKIFSVSPHAVWIWLLLAVGEGDANRKAVKLH